MAPWAPLLPLSPPDWGCLWGLLQVGVGVMAALRVLSGAAFSPLEKFHIFFALKGKHREKPVRMRRGKKRRGLLFIPGMDLPHPSPGRSPRLVQEAWTPATVCMPGAGAPRGTLRQRGPRQLLPGANARHKSSVSLPSDVQSCWNGIIKRN